MGRQSSLVVLLALLALCAPATPARAEGSTEAEIAQARERFGKARKLEDAGRWAEALTLLQQVSAVKSTPQVRFHIALCMENVGLWTEAIDGFQRAAAEAGSSAPDVVREANEHLHKLTSATPTVSLVVRGAAPGDELYLDRRRLVLDDAPLPIRADPGAHTAEVRRGTAVIARQYFALAPRQTLRVELAVGAVAPERAEPTSPTVDPPPIAAPGARGSEPRRDGRAQRVIGWSAVGVGAASAVLTGVFIGLRADALGRLEAACPGLSGCRASVASVVDEGKRDSALVNVFAVLAGVGAATGVALVLTAPAPDPAPAARIDLRFGLAGLSLGGSF